MLHSLLVLALPTVLCSSSGSGAANVPDAPPSAAAFAAPRRILVITEPGCSDSANSIPYIARLVEETPGLELRLVNADTHHPHPG